MPATINGSDTECVTFYCVHGQKKDIFSFLLVLLMKTSLLVCFLCRVHSMSHPKPGYGSMLTSQETMKILPRAGLVWKSKKSGTLRYTVGFPVAKIGFLRPKSVSYGTMWPRLRVLLINNGRRFFVRDYAATYTETCSSVLNFRSTPIFNDFGNFK